MTKYTINELANSKGVSQPVREALLQMADYKQLYEQVCEQYDVLAKELEATNRQVEILSDALAESRREVAALKAVQEPVADVYMAGNMQTNIGTNGRVVYVSTVYSEKPLVKGDKLYTTPPAQPAPVQPVGVTTGCASHEGFFTVVFRSQQPIPDGTDLYTTPPAAQRQWVGLTDAEMYLNCPNWLSHEQCKTWVQQIEAKLKEKNNG